MKQSPAYLMENDDEALRLDVKTDPAAVRKQALWCGVRPNLRVLDLGCGSGRTTSILRDMVAPGGSVVGVDYSPARIAYARKHFGGEKGIDFAVRDLTKPIAGLGAFDLIWVRFVLEYYREESRSLVGNLKNLLKPGGYLCLLDLDNNCLGHYELPASMAVILPKLMACLEEQCNFDAYAGRKLYSYLYDQHYENIELEMMAHHLIYGQAREEDIFNWFTKAEVATGKMGTLFTDYPGGFATFLSDFRKFFLDPRRFTYTPLIMAKGMRPYAD